MTQEYPSWIPRPLLSDGGKRIIRYGQQNNSVCKRLLTDSRLSKFWKWYESEALPQSVERIMNTTHRAGDCDPAETAAGAFFMGLIRNFDGPDRVESMTKSERAEYLTDVRRTANKLIGLLRGTQFDLGMWDGAWNLSDWHLKNILETDLSHVCNQETIYRQRTFYFDKEDQEAWALAKEYPMNSLTEILQEVSQWADDPSSLGPMFEMRHVVKQRGTRGLKAYTTTRLAFKYRIQPFRDFTMPYEYIADLVNVSLALEEDEQISATAARKTVERSIEEIERLERHEWT